MVRTGRGAAFGELLLRTAPLLMKLLSVVGTAAMFLVGGGILVHGVPALHHLIEPLAAAAGTLAPLVSVLGIGQLILEGIKGKQWVHVSTRVPSKASNRVITITDKGAQLGIQDLT